MINVENNHVFKPNCEENALLKSAVVCGSKLRMALLFAQFASRYNQFEHADSEFRTATSLLWHNLTWQIVGACFKALFSDPNRLPRRATGRCDGVTFHVYRVHWQLPLGSYQSKTVISLMGQTLNDLNTGNELLREIDTWLINEEEVSDTKIGYARRWYWKTKWRPKMSDAKY